ncbi:MAG: hypothetical protein QOD74_1540 [Variibacter sp.]|nr:hypothetical protein [Variibacter sp.]
MANNFLSERDDVLGTVVAVTGSQAMARLDVSRRESEATRATVGKFLAIHTGAALLIGVITRLGLPENGQSGATGHATAEIDLLGEIRSRAGAAAKFQRGVTDYPAVGDSVRLVDHGELRIVFDMTGPNSMNIGHLQQDHSIGAFVNAEQMLTKHFAVFGTTGVGKSSGVALILRSLLEARPDLRIFLIDPHNEYGACFEDRAHVLNPRNVRLPFWLFNFEEIVDAVFRARPGVEEEVEILAELIPQAKLLSATNRDSVIGRKLDGKKLDGKSTGFTVDTPVPYQLTDLVGLLKERMGKLENRSSWSKYHRLIGRIESVRADPRYSFMFDNANVGGDTMVEVLRQLFRLPTNGKPMTIMQLAGFPAEVVDSVVSVLCRMAFDFGLWSDGAVPLLFVCEESHRYAPSDPGLGFGPTRKAISRIAKEGRKYGVFLGLVTQRPAELDTTIISQCSTLFAMRMANDRDQAIVRAAVSDAAASLIGFVPSLGTREVFAFGEGVALPTRLHFKELPAHLIPKSEATANGRMAADKAGEKDFVAAVVERWRGAMMSQKIKADDVDDIEGLAMEEFQSVPHGMAMERDPQQGELHQRELLHQGFSRPPAAPSFVHAPAAPSAPYEGNPGGRGLSSELQELRQRLRARNS